MGLSARERTRYARHLLLPHVGEAGQARLLAARAHKAPEAEAEAWAVARDYLARAGVRVGELGERADEGVAPLEPSFEVRTHASARVAGDAALLHAARALAGALAAVDTLRAIVGFEGSAQREVTPLSVLAEEV